MIEWMTLAEKGRKILPDTFTFLQAWWFVVHVVAVSLVFWAGLVVGRRRRCKAEGSQPPAA